MIQDCATELVELSLFQSSFYKNTSRLAFKVGNMNEILAVLNNYSELLPSPPENYRNKEETKMSKDKVPDSLRKSPASLKQCSNSPQHY